MIVLNVLCKVKHHKAKTTFFANTAPHHWGNLDFLRR